LIVLDKRSGSFELLPFFPKGLAKLGNLTYGDASFLGNGPDGPVFVGVERKTIHDMISSVDTGRLQGHQIPGLLKSYGRVYIILEGLWRVGSGGILETWWSRNKPKKSGFFPLKHGGRTYVASAIHNLINTLYCQCGIMTFRTDNSTHTASLIKDLYTWYQKPWDKHTGHLGFKVDPHPVDLRVGKPGIVRRVLKELPGVGWERSGEAEQYFPTVASIMEASKSQWEQIPTIGKVLADRIWEAIHNG
jgi:ERCC4-type nuclease